MFRLSSCFALATVWVLRINELVIPNFIQENVADDEQLLVETREHIVSLFYDCNYVYGLKYSFCYRWEWKREGLRAGRC